MGRPSSRSPKQLTEAHLPLVRAIARRYAGRGEDLDDLVQLGAVGLIKASKRFDPNRGVAFATFATPAIEGEIRRHLRDHSSPLRIPRQLDLMNAEVRQSDSELSATLGRSPTLTELASALGVDESDIERALSVEQARDAVSISSEDADLELPTETSALIDSDDRLLLARSIRALDERERRIVFLRFHADMTERQIGRELGISQAHVSRLLAGALTQLRKDLAHTGDPAQSGDITSVISPTNAAGDRRIAAMDAPADGLTLADYLELPYHVEIRGEQDKKGGPEWKAIVEELPGCVSRGSTPDEAVAQLRPAMESWLTAALADNREIPLPGGDAGASRSSRSHSGRFLVRMPKSLHEQLALAAEREHVSLNRFVTETLAASLTASQRAESPAGSEPAADMDPVTAGAPSPASTPHDETPVPTSTPPLVGTLTPSSTPTPASTSPPRSFRVALATNLAVVVVAGLVAVFLLVLALQRGI